MSDSVVPYVCKALAHSGMRSIVFLFRANDPRAQQLAAAPELATRIVHSGSTNMTWSMDADAAAGDMTAWCRTLTFEDEHTLLLPCEHFFFGDGSECGCLTFSAWYDRVVADMQQQKQRQRTETWPVFFAEVLAEASASAC